MSTPGSGWFIKKPQPQQQQQAQPKKIQGRGGTISSLISEGGGLGGAAAGAALGTAILPGIGTLLGGAIGGVAGDLGGQSVENKVRDNSWHVDNPVQREALNGGLGLLPFGTVAGKGAKGFKAAREAGKVFEGAVDAKPRFEIDDSKAFFNPNAVKQLPEKKVINQYAKGRMSDEELKNQIEGYPVSRYFQHPELYDNYPDVANIPLQLDKTLDPYEGGNFDGTTLRLNANNSPEKLKSTLLHELQHAIQGKEGFAGGGSPDEIKKRLLKEAKQYTGDDRQIARGNAEMDAWDEYHHLAGEAEARAVAARADMPASERYKLPDDILSERARKHTTLESYLQDLNDAGEPVLFHGGADGDTLHNNQFYGDFYQHAESYADSPRGVHGIKYDPKDLMHFNGPELIDMQDKLKGMSTQELKKIYDPIIKEGRLAGAQYEGDIADNQVVPYVKRFLTTSEGHESSKVHNDLMMPLMQHYAEKQGKHIVGFEGNDYMGSNEYVVGDLSRTKNLADVHKEASKPKSTFYNSYDVPREDLIYKPAGVDGPAAFVRRPDKPTELMATHNLSVDNLLHADKLGGLPQPSVGIVDPEKHVINGFGDITLIGNNKLVDPKIKGNNTFASDVYSPRQPHGRTDIKPSDLANLRNEVQPHLDKYGDGFLHANSYDDIATGLEKNPGIMAHFLESKKVKPEVVHDQATFEQYIDAIKEQGGMNEFIHDLDNSIVGHTTVDIADWMKSKGMKFPEPKNLDFTNTRRAMEKQLSQLNLNDEFTKHVNDLIAKHNGRSVLSAGWTVNGNKREIPETLDNALKVMRKTPLRGGEGDFGVGSIRAHITPKLKSVDDIYKNKDKLIPTHEFNQIRDDLDVQKEHLGYQIREALINHDILGEDSDEVIKRYLTDKRPEDWIKNFQNGALAELGPELRDFRHALKIAPTEYFESVPNRAVNLNEFEKALVPHDAPQTVLDKLKGHGIEHLFYNDLAGFKTSPGDWLGDAAKALSADAEAAKGAGLPTRAELLKQQMAEDNAKRFNPDGTPKIPTAAMLSAKNNEAIKAFDAGDKELGKKLTAEYNAMINLTRETTDGKLANGMTTKEITENLRTGKLNLNDLETDMDVGKIPMDEHKFVRQAINDYKNAKAAVFRTGPEQYNENGTEKVARERFNLPALKKLSGGGSDRDVYDLGDGHVLKVSKTARGLAQNDAEVDYVAQDMGLIPETKEAGKNYVVSVKVNPLDKKGRAQVMSLQRASYSSEDDFHKKLEDLGLSDWRNYDYMKGDLTAMRNWGMTDDGKLIHVDGGTLNKHILTDERYSATQQLTDTQMGNVIAHRYSYGKKPKNLDDPDFGPIYHESKALKKKYGDMDPATMYGVAAAAAAGAAGWHVLTPEERKKRAQAA